MLEIGKAVVFGPAMFRVVREGHPKSALINVPTISILKAAWKELLKAISEFISIRPRHALHEFRLPALLISAASLPALLFILLTKIFTFLEVSSEYSVAQAFDWFANIPERHLISIILLIVYIGQFFFWNSELDDELLKESDCQNARSHSNASPNFSRTSPDTGSVEGSFQGMPRKEDIMERYSQFPTGRAFEELYMRVHAEANAQGQTPEQQARERYRSRMRGVHIEVADRVVPRPKWPKV